MKIKNFQEATAERIFELFSKKHQKRVMLSDEVGLGKTIVASRVVELVREWHKELGDTSYRVVYICSNLAISRSNTTKLGIKEKDQIDFRNSRLSMAHLEISKRLNQTVCSDSNMSELIIPLTPMTSFNLTKSAGNIHERALMYLHLKNQDRLQQYNDLLYTNFCRGVKGWSETVKLYSKEIKQCEPSYRNDIKEKLSELMQNKDYEDLIEMLVNHLCGTAYYKIMNRIRLIFAQLSISMLEPDLVIMDEFQRFNSLIDLKNDRPSEQALLFDKLLKNTSLQNSKKEGPNILLLSATPYKMYSTLEELNIKGVDTSLNEFMTVAQFLNYSDESFLQFSNSWNDYCRALAAGNNSNREFLFKCKDNAEQALYNVMCRTERPNMGIISTDGVKELEIEESDITSFVQMQQLLDNAVKARNSKVIHRNVPIEYIKSSPYLLSFMENYTLKKDLKTYIEKHNDAVSNKKSTLVTSNKVYNYDNVDPGNAKLKLMRDILFSKKENQLLWVPTSHPYYKVDGIFEKNADFSKILVFSAWEMVPRMLAVMLSYYSEQKNASLLKVRKKQDEQVQKLNYTNGAKYGRNRLKLVTDENSSRENLLIYPCRTLANMYNPKEYLGQKLDIIIKDIKIKLSTKLKETGFEVIGGSKFGVQQMLKVMRQLDGFDNGLSVITENAVDVMVMIAIASPAVCIYRTLLFNSVDREIPDKDIIENCTKGAISFISVFNDPEAAMIIDTIYAKKEEFYYESVLDYCMKGNLQAVLDEYQFTLQDTPIYEALGMCMLNVSNLDIETVGSIREPNKSKSNSDLSNADAKKLHMRCSFAVPYVDKMSSITKENRITNKQCAFNSPFRPFVMSTTSIGQEGLDFHQYTRKIVHWNLPSNPVDLEQREGRINRFCCLAVRRNVSKLFGVRFSWNSMFKCASNRLKEGLSDMVPFWCLPIDKLTEEEKKELEYIERIVPLYPFSRDMVRYEQLIKVLSMYRMTMGMPRQEELLELLQTMNFNSTDVNSLTLNLCPWDKLDS